MAQTERRFEEEQSRLESATLRTHVGCHSQLRQMLAASATRSLDPDSDWAAPIPAPRLICFNLGDLAHPQLLLYTCIGVIIETNFSMLGIAMCIMLGLQLILQNVRAVAGYLPTGDQDIITKAETTLQALDAAMDVIDVGGVISIAAYIGHPGGQAEYEQLRQRMAGLDKYRWLATESGVINVSLAPILLLLYRRKP